MKQFFSGIRSYYLALVFMLGALPGIAQTHQAHQMSSGDLSEQLWQQKGAAWEHNLAQTVGATTGEFAEFLLFNEATLLKSRAKFFHEFAHGNITTDNADAYFYQLDEKFIALFAEYNALKINNPGFIEDELDGRRQQAGRPGARGTCNPSCSNIGFGNGTLSFWDSYWAVDASTTAAVVLNYKTGGPSGSVTVDAYDANTASYQVSLMNAGGTDPIAGSLIPLNPPLGGYAARIGDGAQNGYGVGILEQTFNISASNPILTIQYAVVLENPGHIGYEQPWFNIEVLDQNGTAIPGCGQYFVVSGANIPGFVPVLRYAGGDTVYCRPWTTAFVPLQAYAGQCVTVRYTASDCAQGGHFGYAYVSASCAKIKLNASSTVFCNGQQSAKITGPPGAAAYQWTTPNGCISGSSTQQILTIACAGTYKLVTASTAGPQCVDTFSITITASSAGPPPTPCFTWDTVCSGTPVPINASCSNPNTGGKFYWDFYGTGFYQDSSGTTPTWIPPNGGDFNVRLHQVTAAGCSSDTVISVNVINTNAYAIPQTNMAITNASSCTTCNGTIVFKPVLPPGATAGYTYKFACNPTVITYSPPNNYSFAGGSLAIPAFGIAGDYSFDLFSTPVKITLYRICPGNCEVYITSADTTPPNRCSLAQFVSDSISAFIPVSGVNIVLNQTVSPATCGLNNGSASIVATGGTAPYKYKWSVGDTTSSVSGLSGGTYEVTITENGGCQATATVVVDSIPQLGVTTIPYFVSCPGNNDGKIKVKVVGGNGPFTYTWSPNVSTVDSATGLGPATYSITVSDLGGCSGTVSTNITQPIPITNTFTGSYSNIPCFGTGNATVNPSGGAAPYTYLWASGTTNATDTGLTVGKHAVTITDASSCTKIDTVTVVGTASLTITGHSICLGDSVLLTCNGTSGFQWSTGASTASIKVSPLTTSVYSVTASNICGAASASITVNVNMLPNAVITPANPSVCPGQSTTLKASGGNAYSWSIGGNTDTLKVSPVVNTTYKVTVTDVNLCSATVSATVTIVSAIDTAKVTVTPSSITACVGSLLNFTATPFFGGTAPTYVWKVNGIAAGTTSNTFSSNSLNNQDIVTCVMTSSESCIAGSPATSNSVVTTILPLFKAGVVSSVPDSVCSGTNALLTVTGNSSAIQWQNSTNSTGFVDINGAVSATYTEAPSQTTYYRVYGSNGYCSDTSVTLKLVVKALPAAPALTALDTLICSGENAEICAPDTFVSYSWNNGGTSSCTQATFAGGYWVSVTAANGCSVISQRKNIAIYPVPSVAIIRQGDTLSSFGAVSYQWYLNGNKIPGATSSIYIAKGFGNFTLEITDANGCKATSSPVVISGLNDFDMEGSLEIYPNPATENLQIKADKRRLGQEFEIYDVIGQVIERGYLSHELMVINVAQMSNGLYFVKVNGLVLRFMKQ